VRATEDVFVKDQVSGAIFSDRSVTIKGGVTGGESLGFGERPPEGVVDNHGRIQAGANASCQHGSYARIDAAEIEVRKDAVNCHLQGLVIRIGGRMIGGSAHAEVEVHVRECGHPRGTTTTIYAGHPVERHDEAARALIAAARARRVAGHARIAAGRTAKIAKQARAERELVDEHVSRALERRQRIRELSGSARVELALAHPGVVVHVGEQSLRITSTTTRATIRIDPETSSLVLEKAT
jgi:hypothetical protein